MAARSIASLSITFGLVSIPVKLYTATESSSAIRFKVMGRGGVRLRQQYVADSPPPAAPPLEAEPPPAPAAARGQTGAAADKVVAFPSRTAVAPPPEPEPAVVERAEMVKAYEFEPGRFVLFTPEELKALEESSRQSIDIVAFAPLASVDPVYYDKAYYLAPDKRGAKPYSLLKRAMLEADRCAIGKWAWRSKEYVVQIRPTEGGMVLQQLLYADEVRRIDDLAIDEVVVGAAELQLARQLIEQITVERYDPSVYRDEEKARILAAVERKIAGKEIVAPGERQGASATSGSGGAVLDLMEALRASLASAKPERPSKAIAASASPTGARKPARRSTKTAAPTQPPERVGRS